MVKNLPAIAGDIRDPVLIPGSRRSPRGGHSNLFQYFFLPGESHAQRSLADCSPWACKESDTTGATEHTCIQIS